MQDFCVGGKRQEIETTITSEFHIHLNNKPNLVLVDILGQLCLSQLVEGDDDEGDKDVDEEEGEDDEVDDVEDGDLRLEPGDGALVLVRRRHRVLQDPAIRIR